MSCLKTFAMVSSLLSTRIRGASPTAETIRASYFPEPTDHGLQNKFPRGAVWLQTGAQHRGQDIWCQAGQEKGIEQNKALYSVFIDFTQRPLIQSTGRAPGRSWRDMANQRRL